jgi:hypothetical protein
MSPVVDNATAANREGTTLFRDELKHRNYEVTVRCDAPRSLRPPTCYGSVRIAGLIDIMRRETGFDPEAITVRAVLALMSLGPAPPLWQ